MVKTLDNPPDVADDTEQKSRRKPLLASYEPDLRAEGWLKVKKDYDKGSDSLDLVPIGAWHGILSVSGLSDMTRHGTQSVVVLANFTRSA